jgi:hypothetical protein
MARLTAKDRQALPASDFAGGKGHYPIPDKKHAALAESMVSRYGDSALKAKVRAAVKAKYPGMGK